jgi:hypothetical protein
MRNFFIQSDDLEVQRLMQATGQNAIDKATGVMTGHGVSGRLSSRNPIHIYAFGGSRAWLHMRVESPQGYTDMHPLYY